MLGEREGGLSFRVQYIEIFLLLFFSPSPLFFFRIANSCMHHTTHNIELVHGIVVGTEVAVNLSALGSSSQVGCTDST